MKNFILNILTGLFFISLFSGLFFVAAEIIEFIWTSEVIFPIFVVLAFLWCFHFIGKIIREG